MKYLERLEIEGRDDLVEYTKVIFGEDIPEFIEDFLKLKIFKDLDGKGQFCGVKYASIYNPKFSYSRLNHSVNTAGLIWRLTHDKKKAICALVHDLGTPCFAHTIDYLLKDYLNQGSSEKDISEILASDKEFLALLAKEGIKLEEINDPMLYSIVDIDRPGVCADRLEGILSIGYIWLQKFSLDEVKMIIENLCICVNENGLEEIGLKDVNAAELFFEVMLAYAYDLVDSKHTYCMQVVADIIDYAIKMQVIKLEDLYTKGEEEIVDILRQFESWKAYVNMNEVYVTNAKPDYYYVNVTVKKRYAIPIVKGEKKDIRITELDINLNNLLNDFLDYEQKAYAYSPQIREIGEIDVKSK